MGLFSLAFAGGSFILIGAWESLSSPFSSSKKPHHRFSTITLISSASLSILFMIHSLYSLFDAIHSKDKLGSSLQLQVLSISSLFLIFSLLGLLTNLSKSLSFPYQLTNLVLLFAFVEEFLLFYLHLKDPNGIENRYFSLLLVPISVCLFSTMIELYCPDSNAPRLARGVGLILHGTWFVQMGLSFYTNLIAQNCVLHQKSRGNYTIKCMGHMDAHRGGAIATLLFNCHLALIVAVISGVYSVFGRKFVGVVDYNNYRPIVVGENYRVENQSQFTLDSDSDEGDVDVIKQQDEGSSRRENGGAVELTMNGHGSH